ncbi:tripartite tricarboxylate transporter TctB family protein [Nitratireductor arenosus]|nr:tripartite tricarboxylate transporter TctB family protein [Nitratireductor arenosus]
MSDFNRNELQAALVLIGLGIGCLIIALGYPMGTVVRMGAGFFPVALSVLLIGLGAVLAWQSRTAEKTEVVLRLRPFVMILGGILAWALMVDRIGFLPATAILVVLCAMVERETTWRSALLLTAGLCVFGWLVFIVGLKIPLSMLGG